ALLLFDCSDAGDPFRGIPYWAKALQKHAPDAPRLLVSARCDVSPVTVERREIVRVMGEYGLDDYASTSAYTGEGVEELLHKVLDSIRWDLLPRASRPRLFQVIREFLLERKAEGGVLISMGEIRRQVRQRYTEREATQAEIDTVVGLLQGQGMMYRIDIMRTVLVLLRPEFINCYAASIIQAARKHPQGAGAVPERDALTARIAIAGFERLDDAEEWVVLEATVESLIEHDLGFREMGQLVFPSQINVTCPTPPEEQPRAEVVYRFSGSIEAIYASLVVRLSYTEYFKREDQWKYAVEFSRDDNRLGFAMQQVEEGTGELEVYFY
ncbi:MAG: hypothetical protein GY842_19145, partial [bacterium]|nr:hypothetical protein [bacterium]